MGAPRVFDMFVGTIEVAVSSTICLNVRYVSLLIQDGHYWPKR